MIIIITIVLKMFQAHKKLKSSVFPQVLFKENDY